MTRLNTVLTVNFSRKNIQPISVENKIVPPFTMGKVTDDPSAPGCVPSAMK